jgi:methionyl-tRNA synthetase
VQLANKFLQNTQPWKLEKNEAKQIIKGIGFIIHKLNLLISPFLIDGYAKVCENF